MSSTQQCTVEASEPTTLLLKARMPPKNSPNHTNVGNWTHIATGPVLAWLLFSIPIVIWDLCFCLLRPLTFPGGSLAWPIWVPYEIYMRTDYIYDWKAFNEKNGFTSAQAFMNIPETLLYALYLYIAYSQGTPLKATFGSTKSNWIARRSITGQAGALAAMIGFAAAVMTLSKTLLYVLNEAFSGWSNVGHNEWINLIFLWIILNGAWIVAPACMVFAFGNSILRAMCSAAGAPLVEGASIKKKE